MKIKNLLFNPEEFFKGLFIRENYKRTAIYLLVISLIWYFLTFLRIIISVHSPNIFSRDIGSDILYGSFGFPAVKGFFIVLVVVILMIFLFSVIFSLIIKLILLISKIKKFPYRSIWTITTYSLTPLLIYSLIDLLTLFPALSFLEYSIYLFYLYALILLTIGVIITAKLSGKRLKVFLTGIFIILILVATFFTISEIKSVKEEKENTFTSFSAKIGDVTTFTKDDIISVCKTPKCIELLSHCYESSGNEWNCKYAFDVTLNTIASNKFVEITNNLNIVEEYENEYLEEPLSFYLDGEKIGEVLLSSDLKGREITQVSIFGTSKGKTRFRATDQALSDMRKLQLFLDSDS